MNRTIKEATVRTYHYDGHAQLREHLGAFLSAYNFANHLKSLHAPHFLSVHHFLLPLPLYFLSTASLLD